MNVKFEVYYQILKSLQNFLHQYATQNIFEDEKQTQLFNKVLELHPYLNSQYNQASNLSSTISLNFKNQNTFINFPHHIFNDVFETSTLIKEQKHIFELLTSTNKRLHTLQGPPRSGKTFFVRYLIHQLQLQGKKVLLLITIRAIALRLSPHAYTVHSTF
jgi:primosomal protein N'